MVVLVAPNFSWMAQIRLIECILKNKPKLSLEQKESFVWCSGAVASTGFRVANRTCTAVYVLLATRHLVTGKSLTNLQQLHHLSHSRIQAASIPTTSGSEMCLAAAATFNFLSEFTNDLPCVQSFSCC